LKDEGFGRSKPPDILSLEKKMQDLIWTAVTIAFFAASVAYVHFCDRVK